MAKRKTTPKQKRPAVKAGDLVLTGMRGITMPSDWLFCKVLLVAGNEIATEHEASGGMQRQFQHIDRVLLVGDVPRLAAFKRNAIRAVAKLQKRVRDREHALGQARDAVWAKLDEIWDQTAEDA